MFITEPVIIEDIRVSERYPYIRIITFKDRLYKVILASNEIFNVGEEVLYIPDGTILPEYLLKRLGFWDYKYKHGVIGGKYGNIVKASMYARDPDYISSGIILKAQNGVIEGFSDSFDIHTPEIDKLLKLMYIQKKDISFFTGDIYLADVEVRKSHLLDIEHVHPQLQNQYVEYEELVKGRKFYVTLCKFRSHHHAAGNRKNIFVTTDTLGKYRFLSNTKDNLSTNIIYKTIDHLNLFERLENVGNDHSTWHKITLGMVLRANAYSGHYPQKDEMVRNTLVVDVYINDVPLGKYLSQSEYHILCQRYGFKTPPYLGEGVYSIDTVREMLDTRYGVAVKAVDGKLAAGAYSDEAKLRFIRNTLS